jgi:glycosyltransferase involved in cell wall biosynthesis
MKIGQNGKDYNNKRNIFTLNKSISLIFERDLFNIVFSLYWFINKKSNPFLQFLHFDIGLSKTNLKHFFNTISLNSNFIVTFETTLPRLGNSPKYIYKIVVKSLISQRCKKIIAISQCAYDLQLNFIQQNYPVNFDIIKEKMIVLHPPQELLINNYNDKSLSGNIIFFTLIGSEFFRKGGREILNVFDSLIPIFPHVRLNIVSSLQYGDYATKSTMKDLNKAKQIIKKYPENIIYYPKLPNQQVLELLKRTHICLLPSWGDTYGYSALEAQAAGCPVITTNLRAFPEINNNEIGWIIDVPKNKDCNGVLNTFEERELFQKIIESGLTKIILQILINGTDTIKDKGIKALEKIKTQHSPSKNAEILEKIYEKVY